MQPQFLKPSFSTSDIPLCEVLRRRALQWVKRHARVTRGHWVDVVAVNGLTFEAWATQFESKKQMPTVFEDVVFDCYPRELLPEGLTSAMVDSGTDRALPWSRWTPQAIEAYEAEVILTLQDDDVTPVRYRLLAKAARENTEPAYVTPAQRAKLLGRATYDKSDVLWDDSMDYVRPGFSASTKKTARKVRLMAVERLSQPVQLLPINKVVKTAG